MLSVEKLLLTWQNIKKFQAPYLNAGSFGKIIQACCFSTCNIPLNTDLAKEDINL